MKRVMLALLGCCVLAAAAASVEPVRGGHLVLNGGGSKPAVVMETFIELAGGPDADIVVFPTASEESDTGEYYRKIFEGFGCREVWDAGVRSRDDARDHDLADRVAVADGIWFSGGDQRRITKALMDTPVGEAVRRAVEGGAVIGGTSAGTACQSGLMITGDGDFTVITSDNVELWDGLGLFRGVIVDQHFVARGRHNRLISVVLEHPELLGVGVDEATAVWVRPDGSFKVLGEGWVVVFDAAAADVTTGPWRDGATALGVHGLVTHVLLPGEVFDVAARAVVEEDPWTTE